MTMQLDVWKGDWGLPSVDFECLQAMVFAKISNAPVEVRKTNNPFWSARGCLPIFRAGNIVLHDFKTIKKYLQDQNFNADSKLGTKQIAEINAYYNLLEHKLIPALQYIWWVDERNYTELFRKWYSKALPFPLNYVYPGRYEKSARMLLEALYNDETDLKTIETNVYGEAEKCISNLSVRLGDSPYFLGSSPTSFDAIVYGYLAPVLKAPFLTQNLQNHLKACTNLVKYIDRITKNIFPEDSDYIYRTVPETKPTEAELVDFPHATRNKFLAGLVATAAMLGWALLHGFIPVSLEDSSEFEEMFEVELDEEAH